MGKTHQVNLRSDVLEPMVSVAATSVPFVIALEAHPATDPERPPAAGPAPGVLLLAHLNVLAPVIPPELRVGTIYFLPDLTDWLPEPSVPEKGQGDLDAGVVVPAGGDSLNIHREAVRSYMISRVTDTVEEAAQWLRAGDPQGQRCLLTLREHQAIMANLPAEVRRTAMVAELWMGDQAQQQVYVVMSTVSPGDSQGYVLVGPPVRANRAA